MDMMAICNGLAARYAPGTIATPSGSEPMRSSVGQAENSVPATPAFVVMPQTGEIVLEAGAWTQTHQIDGIFLLSKAPGDIARIELQRQLWLPTLLTATLSGYTLSLAGTVKSALPIGYEFQVYPYNGTDYEAIVIHFEVIVRETVSMAA